MKPNTIWTVGHSNHSAEDFRAILAAHDIEHVADVRRFPNSRRLPQFESTQLAHDLATINVSYQWIEQLGGRRRPDPHSINDGWRHPSFRGYADHLASEEFSDGLTALLMVADGLRTAVMCAEVLWWRCHRRLIADVLVFLGIRVIHIRDRAITEEHRLGPPARVVRGALTYATPRTRAPVTRAR
jgi:uncharacterized protein (DUF488 family)